MQCGPRHKETDDTGVGLCSVPMWMNGVPAGFCDEPAYGTPIPCKQYRNAYTGRMERWDGRYNGYVPGLACPGHGGPNSRVFRDGNQWCAVMPDFVNLQDSAAGFGDTKEAAREDLQRVLRQQA